MLETLRQEIETLPPEAKQQDYHAEVLKMDSEWAIADPDVIIDDY